MNRYEHFYGTKYTIFIKKYTIIINLVIDVGLLQFYNQFTGGKGK